MKYILFDLDGTLTDPAEGITKSVEYALTRFGINVEKSSDLFSFIGPPLIDSFMEYYGFSRENAERAVEIYREYFSATGIFENKVYEGIEDLLKELNNKGYKLVLATSKPELFANKILEHFNLEKYFFFVAGATMEETRTKKDDVIEYALSQIGFCGEDKAIMVGDRCYDILGGKKCGLKTIGVTYGYGTREELENSKADFIAENIAELDKLINTIM